MGDELLIIFLFSLNVQIFSTETQLDFSYNSLFAYTLHVNYYTAILFATIKVSTLL